jgi:anthranilate/para-aminobenzoate synthase component II
MRYHSLVVSPDNLPAELEVIAWSGDRPQGREIMGLKHRTHRVWGVQFHPESVGTPAGRQLLTNFLRLASVLEDVPAI